NPSLARWRAQEWRADRYRAGTWPSTNAAKRPFGGSFDAAVRAAGLEPHRSGPRRRPAGVARPGVEQRAPMAPRSVDDALLEASEWRTAATRTELASATESALRDAAAGAAVSEAVSAARREAGAAWQAAREAESRAAKAESRSRELAALVCGEQRQLTVDELA